MKRNLKTVQKEAEQHREKDLERLAEKRASEWNIKASKAIIVIKTSKELQRLHKKQRAFLKPKQGGGIRKILVPRPITNIEPKTSDITNEKIQCSVDDPKEIFNILLRQNYRHLIKSQESVFTTGKLAEELGDTLENETVNEILAGVKLSNDIIEAHSEYGSTFEHFIQSMKQATDSLGNNIENYKWHFGVEEYREAFGKTKETIACGPSGLHMSHWKAALENEKIIKIHSFFIWSAFQFGHSYTRWDVSWHCMIQKKKHPFSQKLRIIQLFEGDFNAGLKYLLGRKLLWHMHNKQLIDEEIYGSRKGKTGSEALISLQLLADHSRTWKKNTAVLFNDADGCYDRIPPTLAEIALRRLGCPETITKAHTTAQRSMKHYIKTSTGVSEGYIKFSRRSKRHIRNGVIMILSGLIGGVGQGGGASPVIWMAILIILLKAYKKTQLGATITDFILNTIIPLWIISYVDDNSIVRHFSETSTVPEMLEGMKSNLFEWQKLLQLTGGDLSLEKCQVIIMRWYQDGVWGTPKMQKLQHQNETIHIQSLKSTMQSEQLVRLDPDKAERVLGIRLPLTGSMTMEKKFRQQQLKEFCTNLYNSPLSHYEAHSAYQTRYKSIATYPYTVTTFSTKTLNEIQKSSVKLLLPKLGVNRNMPRAVIYGPRALGGRQLMNLVVEQPARNLHTTIGHLRRQDRLSTILYATMRDIQLEIGTKEPFFKLDPNKYTYATENTRWLYTWKTAKEFGITLEIAKFWTPMPKYYDDKNIMSYAVKDPTYNGKNNYKLQSLNRCRLYQEAIFLSDLM